MAHATPSIFPTGNTALTRALPTEDTSRGKSHLLKQVG